jgi:ketosteroid isomerase-like protein
MQHTLPYLQRSGYRLVERERLMIRPFAILGLLVLVSWMTASSQTPHPTSDGQELIRLEQEYNDAQVKRDRPTLERLWADDYLYTHSNGAVMNKAQDIADTMSGEMMWSAARVDDTHVRLYGDVGIVTGRLTMVGRSAQYASGPRRFTDVFVKRKGRWQLVGGQTTMIPGK